MQPLRLIAVLVLNLCFLAIGKCEDFPNRMVDLIRGESSVGVKRIEKSNDYVLTIVTKEQARLEEDIAQLTASDLFAKYPEVKEQGNAKLQAFERELGRKKSELPSGVRYGQARLRIFPTAGEVHSVLHVGDDYVMLESAPGDGNRFAVNCDLIREIRWYGGPVYSTSVKHLRQNETE